MTGMQKRRPRDSALQTDLFGEHANAATVSRAPVNGNKHARAFTWPMTLEDELRLVAKLEETGRYRIQRQLKPRPVIENYALIPGRSIGIILDTETTGLDYRKDEIIELGMVAFTYDSGGIHDVIGVFSELREPSLPISAEITHITGITQDMVAGRSIDVDTVSSFIAGADLIIAHNAKFDRPFCESFHPDFKYKAWACSVAEVDWGALDFEGSKLVYLIGQCGFFHNGHRAVDDCHALLEVLVATSRTEAPNGFCQLLTSSAKERLHVFAHGSPFEAKEMLRNRGYRWNDGNDGRPRSWWVEIDEAAYVEELSFLQQEIYQSDADPIVRRLTAYDRYRA